jgi:hypothetical protein
VAAEREKAMSEPMAERVTKRQAQYLEHLRAAKSQGLHLSEYCRRHDLNVREWYRIRREMVRKGIAGRTHGSGTKAMRTRTRFAPVHVTAAPMLGPSGICRIRHRSGWVIECASLPPPAWISALTEERRP